MTRIEGHPPAANYGPEIRLPDAYLKRWEDHQDDTECWACEVADDGICPGHRDDWAEDEAADAARARWEVGE